MSAFVCNDTHIRYLVRAIAKWTDDKRDPDEIGQILVNENYRSVNFRYSENDPAPAFHYGKTFQPLTPIQVLKACHCLQYQICECDDYRQTEAWRLLEDLEREAIRRLPGFEQAEWEIRP